MYRYLAIAAALAAAGPVLGQPRDKAAERPTTDLTRALTHADPAERARATAGSPFAGKAVVLTGTLERYERDQLKEILA